MDIIGSSVLSSVVSDVTKFIFGKKLDKIKLDMIDNKIKTELYKKYYNLMNSNTLNKLLSIPSIKDLIEEYILYNISDDIYTGDDYNFKKYNEKIIDKLYVQFEIEAKKENFNVSSKEEFTSFFNDFFVLANQFLYNELDNHEKIQVALFNKSVGNSERNIIFFMQQLQSDIEKLVKVEPVDKINEYHEVVNEYHKILKHRKIKERVYSLDKIEFSKFYVAPLLRQIVEFNEKKLQLNVRTQIGNNKKIHSYDGWKHIFDCNNFVYVIGGPGYGKSLFLTKLITDFEQLNFLNNEEYLIIYGNLKNFKYDDECSMSMLEYLQNCIAKESIMDKKDITKEIIEYYIDSGRCLLLFDALDEVEKNKRNDLHERIVSYLDNKNPNNKICITSRSRGFIPENNHVVYEILPLEQKQIEKYLDNLVKIGKFNENDKALFYKQAAPLIRNNFLNSFLILSLLTNIFKREHELPDTKLDLYKKCFKYIGFEREENKNNQKYNWSDLDELMTIDTFSILASMGIPNNADIDREDIVNVLGNYYVTKYGTLHDARIAVKEFLNYCSERTELFVCSSSDNKFNFFHRSFFEYFYALYIVSYKSNSIIEIIKQLEQFDVDSEIFELTFALIKRDDKKKYHDLVRYLFEKCYLEGKNISDDVNLFNILTLGMITIDEIEYRNKYLKFLIDYKEYILKNNNKILHIKIYEIMRQSDTYMDCINSAYINEAKLDLLNSVFLSVHEGKEEDDYKISDLNELANLISGYSMVNTHNCFYSFIYTMDRCDLSLFDRMTRENYLNLLDECNISSEDKIKKLELFKEYEDIDSSFKTKIIDALKETFTELGKKV